MQNKHYKLHIRMLPAYISSPNKYFNKNLKKKCEHTLSELFLSLIILAMKVIRYFLHKKQKRTKITLFVIILNRNVD